MKIKYSYRESRSGIVRRGEITGAATVTDEPYPPGGILRVLRNERGFPTAGPLVSELLTWEVTP